MAATATHPDPQKLDELVKRIVQACHPQRIILFGSAARGEMNEHSDLDVMIVLPDDADIPASEEEIYRRMRRFGADFDLIVTKENWVKTHQSNPRLVYYHAIKDGRELYRATG